MDKVKLRGQSIGLLSMLGIQFILGMVLNLFVQLPKIHSGTSGNFFSRFVHGFGWAITIGGGIVLTLHVLVAIGLLLGSLALLARAIAVRNKPWIIGSAIGALGVITALTNGLAFIGYNQNATSFVMAMGFFVAATAYSVVLARVHVINPRLKHKSTNRAQISKGFSGRVRHSHT
jgi:glucan phosphoethanolaminetransferase (alkaline phosphatase superfamily)